MLRNNGKKMELFYCYYRNGNRRWQLYYEKGQLHFWQVKLYPAGAKASRGATETSIVSMKRKPPKTLKTLAQGGIIVHQQN